MRKVYFRIKASGRQGTASKKTLEKRFKEYKKLLRKDEKILSIKDGTHPRFGKVKILTLKG